MRYSAQAPESGFRDYRKKGICPGIAYRWHLQSDAHHSYSMCLPQLLHMPSTATSHAHHSYPRCPPQLPMHCGSGQLWPEIRMGMQSSHHTEQGAPRPTCLQSRLPRQWRWGLASLPSESHYLKYLLSQHLSPPLTNTVPKVICLASSVIPLQPCIAITARKCDVVLRAADEFMCTF